MTNDAMERIIKIHGPEFHSYFAYLMIRYALWMVGKSELFWREAGDMGSRCHREKRQDR